MRGNYTDSAKMKKRMYIVLCFVSVVLLVLTIRLSYIMIFKSDEYSELAVEQWTSEVKISAKRGKILDRNGEELAISANVYRVDFDLNAIRDYNKENGTTNEQLAEKIANALNVEYDTVLKKLNMPHRSIHKLRKTYCTMLIDAGCEDSIIMNQLGHASIETSRKYYYFCNRTKQHQMDQVRKAINI